MEIITSTEVFTHENKECEELFKEFKKWIDNPNQTDKNVKKAYDIVRNFIKMRKNKAEIKRVEQIRINAQNNMEHWEKEMYNSSDKQAKFNFYDAVNDLKLLDKEIKRLCQKQ